MLTVRRPSGTPKPTMPSAPWHSSGVPGAIPWPCIHEFLAITTHPKIYQPATPLPIAVDQVRAWLESPTLTLLSEDTEYWTTLDDLLVSSRVVGPKIHDARIAALCIRHGVRELWTADRDFGRFRQLVTREPARRLNRHQTIPAPEQFDLVFSISLMPQRKTLSLLSKRRSISAWVTLPPFASRCIRLTIRSIFSTSAQVSRSW